jgi:hypothetical protein
MRYTMRAIVILLKKVRHAALRYCSVDSFRRFRPSG